MVKLFPTIELLGSMADSEEVILGKASEHGMNATVVKNSAGEVNLALPYYSDIEKAPFTEIEDTDLADVSGGELFGVLAVTFGLAALVGGGVVVGGAVIGADEAKKAK